MPTVGAALSDDLHFRASGTVEIGCLIGGIDLEFLDAVAGVGITPVGPAATPAL